MSQVEFKSKYEIKEHNILNKKFSFRVVEKETGKKVLGLTLTVEDSMLNDLALYTFQSKDDALKKLKKSAIDAIHANFGVK